MYIIYINQNLLLIFDIKPSSRSHPRLFSITLHSLTHLTNNLSSFLTFNQISPYLDRQTEFFFPFFINFTIIYAPTVFSYLYSLCLINFYYFYSQMIYCIIISSFYILLQGVGVTVRVGVDPNFFSVINKQTKKKKKFLAKPQNIYIAIIYIAISHLSLLLPNYYF